MNTLGEPHKNAFVFIKVNPKNRLDVYNKIGKITKIGLYRVTGDIDLIVTVNNSRLEQFLRSISKIEGVVETSAHIVLEMRDV
jgi:DNA-binding Lrp family transcriptional regulator